jgi:presenilin-like A22 family membrane protease
MKHTLKITLFLVILFLGAQYIGLGIVNSYIDVETTKQTGNFTVYPLPDIAGMQLDRPDLQEDTSFVYIIIAVLIGTGIILLLVKYGKINIWKLWFMAAMAVCLTAAFGAFFTSWFASVLGIGLAIWKVLKPNIIIHNFTELFVYGGLAAIFFPVISIWAATMLLILISVYDMYAVWKSKHMVALANFQKDAGMFAGLMLPYERKAAATSTAHKASRTAPGKAVSGKTSPTETKSAILGGGDVGFPLLFAAAVLKGNGMLPALVIPIFAAIALFLLLYMAKKDRFYPAMPFISAGCFVGLLISFLL